MIVFKLARERPAFCCENPEALYYFKDGYIYENNMKLKDRREVALISARRRPGSGGMGMGMGAQNNGPSGAFVPRKLHYNHANKSMHCILLVNSVDNVYELYTMGKDEGSIGREVQPQRGACKSAVFVSSTRFAVLDRNRQITLKSLKNETKRTLKINNLTIGHIFPGGVGRILIRAQESIVLYDVHALKHVAEMPIHSRHSIKYTSWSHDGKYLALYSKLNLYITTSKLEELAMINETSRIKSAAWDPVGVLIYTTATHIKYVLPNGDSGIIRTLDNPIYMTLVNSREITFLDREGNVGQLSINATEYLFKLALMKHRSSDVARIMNSKKLVGQSIISYVQKKGYPEIAMHFVEDVSVKFSLALECGNIEVALQCATMLNQKESWYKLGVEALRQGNHQVCIFTLEMLVSCRVIHRDCVCVLRVCWYVQSYAPELDQYSLPSL
jgi:coatomer protein complex subunit alpha (xenin)